MKTGKQRKAVRLLRLCGSALVVFLLLGSQVWAGSDPGRGDLGQGTGCGCEGLIIDATGYATTPNPMGQYVGTALMTMGPQQHTYWADVVINPQGMPEFMPDGTIRMVLRNQFSCPELAITFECYDHLVLTPVSGDPSRYSITNQAVIFNGTGIFSDAYGKIVVADGQSEMSMVDRSITVHAVGRICDVVDKE